MNLLRAVCFALILIGIFTACSSEDKKDEVCTRSNQITIVFNNPPSDWKIYREAGGYSPARCEIYYINDKFIPVSYSPNSDSEYDTLRVNTHREVVEFRHSYMGIDELSYLFHTGDTVLFTYNEKTPIASILNRKGMANDVNVELQLKESLYSGDYPSYVKYRVPILFMRSSGNLQQGFDSVVNLSYERFQIESRGEKVLLDSLYNENLISSEYYQLFCSKLIYKAKIIELFRQIGGPRVRKNFTPHITKENFDINLGYGVETGLIYGGNVLDIRNDTLLYYGYQNEVLEWIYVYCLQPKVGTIKSTYYIDGVASAGGVIPDYQSLYDSIQTSPLLSQHAKNVLKLRTVQSIIENFNIGEAKKSYTQFKNEIKDTAIINFIDNKYSLESNLDLETYDLRLSSFNKISTTFNELIERNKGKVIYIDFWSSGCPPCIKQFKFSAELKEEYLGREFVQIFISTDSNRGIWEKACARFNVRDESYFIENRFTSKQWEDMEIDFVPHYMLYDSSGNQVLEAAPSPSNKELLTLIDKYLGVS